jgi:prepilin-type processing-associated H-X9-DG protein
MALGAANYEGATGIYPPGLYWSVLTGSYAGYLGTNCGPLVHLAPYMEQGQAYNAVNFLVNIYYNDNLTVHAVGINTLWCPSDGSISEIRTLDAANAFFEPVIAPQAARMAYTSYGGIVGPWFNNTWSIPGVGAGAHPNHGRIKANQLGMFNTCSDVRLSSITDGTSNTMLFGEHAHGLLTADDQLNWQWWDSGNLGDTLITTMWPLNPHRKVQNIDAGLNAKIFIVSASSFHPGGGNFAFVDGSVRFLKDTVQSWPVLPLRTGACPEQVPAAVSVNVVSGFSCTWSKFYDVVPGNQFGIYQALSTRNQGEVISADAY